MNKYQSFQQVWQAIEKGQSFFVAGHLNPDGDSLGCTLAVCSLLERLGKQAYAYASPAIGKDLFFLPGLPACGDPCPFIGRHGFQIVRKMEPLQFLNRASHL